MVLSLVIWLLTTNLMPAAKLVLPRTIEDVCPFECCGYGTWVAMQDSKAYTTKGDASEVAFIVHKGEAVATIGGDYIVRKAGKAIVTQPYSENGHQFSKGDEIAPLAYLGEGAWQIWLQGKFIDLEFYWIRPEIKEWPEMEWWINAKNAQGMKGWLRIRVLQPQDAMSAIRFDQHFSGMDGCD
jgi:hypothetical protein